MAVWSPDRSSYVVGEMLGSHGEWTICKYNVIFGEAFFNSSRRGHNEDRARTIFDIENRTVLQREGLQCLVERWFKVVKMADYW